MRSALEFDPTAISKLSGVWVVLNCIKGATLVSPTFQIVALRMSMKSTKIDVETKVAVPSRRDTPFTSSNPFTINEPAVPCVTLGATPPKFREPIKVESPVPALNNELEAVTFPAIKVPEA